MNAIERVVLCLAMLACGFTSADWGGAPEDSQSVGDRPERREALPASTLSFFAAETLNSRTILKDEDGDKFFEELMLRVDVPVPKAGEYLVFAGLVALDSSTLDGTRLVCNGRPPGLRGRLSIDFPIPLKADSAGMALLEVSFDGEDIRSGGKPGPLLVHLQLAESREYIVPVTPGDFVVPIDVEDTNRFGWLAARIHRIEWAPGDTSSFLPVSLEVARAGRFWIEARGVRGDTIVASAEVGKELGAGVSELKLAWQPKHPELGPPTSVTVEVRNDGMRLDTWTLPFGSEDR